MKKLMLACALSATASGAYADLTITAVYDDPLTGGVPKGVELYDDASYQAFDLDGYNTDAAGGNSAAQSNQRCDNGTGGARNTQTYIQATPTPGEENACAPQATLRLISEIQGTPATQGSNQFGDTDVSPLISQQVTIEGVVVGDFQSSDVDNSKNLNGFFVQEEANDEDGDPSSSEGVFVFDSSFGVDVSLGDQVRVTGTVSQYFGETQINNVTIVEVLATDALNLVNAATISLATNTAVSQSQDGDYQPDLEAYEGMLVTFVDTLQITEQFQLDRFNEIKLVAGSRPYQFTQNNLPDTTLFDTHRQALGARTITYDDGLNVQNANIANLDGFAGFTENNAKRMGDTVTQLTGVLDYKWAGNSASGATWRVRSVTAGDNVFTSTLDGNSPNPRPATAPSVAGTLKLASFNVLNFFTTIDEPGVITAAGHDPRGADSLDEFNRQLPKLVNAIVALDADVLGLVELENEFDAVMDGSTAIEMLVAAVNTALGGTVYDYVYPGQSFVGTDAIAVGFIYKPGVVELATGSSVALLDDTAAAGLAIFASRDFSTDPLFDGPATNRVSLAASFTHIDSDNTFTAVVNHFKSKGPSGLSDTSDPNFDQNDGAGYWNQRRLDAAMAVNEWLSTSPTGIDDEDIVIMGDLNAYAMEEPVQYLLTQGYNNVEDENVYSYVFDGQVGTLDYILLSISLWQKLAGAAVWYINADEADAVDYNLDFGRSASYYNGDTATRNSDHDPLLVGLNLVAQAITTEDLVNFFIEGFRNRTIEGNGQGIWGVIKLFRFYGALRIANWFEDLGRINQSCQMLHRADIYSDGAGQPADNIIGDDVPAMNNRINQVITGLGC